MKLLIDIPEEDYKRVKEKKLDSGLESIITRKIIFRAVKNGTPLPKGHGDLIDRKALLNRPYEKGGFVEWYDEIKYATPIIEADKGE